MGAYAAAEPVMHGLTTLKCLQQPTPFKWSLTAQRSQSRYNSPFGLQSPYMPVSTRQSWHMPCNPRQGMCLAMFRHVRSNKYPVIQTFKVFKSQYHSGFPDHSTNEQGETVYWQGIWSGWREGSPGRRGARRRPRRGTLGSARCRSRCPARSAGAGTPRTARPAAPPSGPTLRQHGEQSSGHYA